MKILGALVSLPAYLLVVQPKQARMPALPGEESFRRLARRERNDENSAVGRRSACLLPTAFCLLFPEESFRRLARRERNDENSAVGRISPAYCLLFSEEVEKGSAASSKAKKLSVTLY